MRAAIPSNEAERLHALQGYDILDTLPEQEYQDIVYLASLICEALIAAVSLVDQDRQWFKARIGLDATETSRDVAFCAHAVLAPASLMIVPDARHDSRFSDNPLVSGAPGIGFYAGAPLLTQDGLAMGTLCVIDHVPRTLSESQQQALAALSRQVMAQLERRQQILKLQDAQAQLLQSEKMASIGQLAAGIAHEINNPVGFVSSNMNSLSNYAKTMFDLIDQSRKIVDEESSSGKAPARLQALSEAAEIDYLRQNLFDLIAESLDGLHRVRDIVQALKDFSHVGSTDWQFSDLHAGIDDTLKMVASEFRNKAQVVKHYGALPPVECLPSQINQVFMNLLVNASHAISKDGVITIATETSGERVTVSISDNGAGIAPENLKRIFEPFFTTKPVGLGTGLGLSVSYNILKKHGGEISVKSVLGVGTTFSVELPMRSPERHAPVKPT